MSRVGFDFSSIASLVGLDIDVASLPRRQRISPQDLDLLDSGSWRRHWPQRSGRPCWNRRRDVCLAGLRRWRVAGSGAEEHPDPDPDGKEADQERSRRHLFLGPLAERGTRRSDQLRQNGHESPDDGEDQTEEALPGERLGSSFRHGEGVPSSSEDAPRLHGRLKRAAETR